MSEISSARLEANRANAQKSTGPTSADGKARSAMNSLAHGLRAETVVLPGEDAELFEATRQGLIDEHKPQTMTEQRLLDTMVAASWALDRARRQEVAALTQRAYAAVAECDQEDTDACAAAYDLSLFDDSKEGMLRLRYMIAHDHAYHRALRNLLALRRQRQREEKAAAKLAAQAEKLAAQAAKLAASGKREPTPPPMPSEAMPSSPAPTTPEQGSRPLERPAPSSSALPSQSAPQTAPTATPRC